MYHIWYARHYRWLFKADMKSYIPLETAAIFFLASLFLQQGISSEYVMVEFICIGLQGAKTILSCTQYCSYMKLMSFCCLTNIYWSNSKMTLISYDYIKEYMTKQEHYLAWYDVAINKTIKTCILLYKF